MKATDLISQDNATVDLDDEIVSALGAFGFVSASGTMFSHPNGGWVYTINAKHGNGSSLTWIGTGKTEEEAVADAVDAVAKWILTQPIPVTP